MAIASRRQVVQRILNETYCRLAPSPIHGVGVFAIRPIMKGTDPFLDGSSQSNTWVSIKPDELDPLPSGLRDLIHNMFVPTDDHTSVPLTGTNLINIGCYLNHSDNPNLITADGNCFRANRTIQNGEELTVDYRTFGAEGLLLSKTDSAGPTT